MKNLAKLIKEGILDTNFDINIEPIDIDGIYNKYLSKELLALEQSNQIVMYHPYLKAITDGVEGFKENLDKKHYDPSLQKIFDQLERWTDSLYKFWTSKKALDEAIDAISRYSKSINVLRELDEQMHKACGADWDKLLIYEYEPGSEFRIQMHICSEKIFDQLQQLSIKGLSVDVTKNAEISIKIS